MIEKFKKMYKENRKDMIIQTTIFLIVSIMLVTAIVYLFINPKRFWNTLFAIFQMCCMLAVIIGSFWLEKKFNIDIPDSLETMFVIFAFCGFILGDVFNFYGKFKMWDSILHTFSGIILAYSAYIIVDIFVKSQKFELVLPPIYVSIAAVLFSVSLGALWEIGEYTADDLFGLNSQQYMKTTSGTIVGENDIPLVGHEALTDTIKDLALDTAGAVVVATLAYIDKTKKSR